METKLTDLENLSAAHGLSVLGITDASCLEEDVQFLVKWQSTGLSGEMSYMNRPANLLTQPKLLLPEARSVITFAVRYESADPGPRPNGHGRVARYAWGRDYHTVLKERITALAESLKQNFNGFTYRVFSDAVPLLERAIARKAGLGFIGKNTMLIRPGVGSFFFLAELLSNLEIKPNSVPRSTLRVNQDERGCGTCQRCLDLCPTNAFLDQRVLDSRRCISYLSIEKRGVLSTEQARNLGEWVFGCDVCQEVCPFNHSAQKNPAILELNEFERRNGVGPYLDLRDILSIRTKQQFELRFGETAITRTGRSGLLRNAAAVLANTRDFTAFDTLKVCAQEDPSPVVRSQSLRALAELGKHGDNRGLSLALRLGSNDSDPIVRTVTEEIMSEN